jgi:hypothetical protein
VVRSSDARRIAGGQEPLQIGAEHRGVGPYRRRDGNPWQSKSVASRCVIGQSKWMDCLIWANFLRFGLQNETRIFGLAKRLRTWDPSARTKVKI